MVDLVAVYSPLYRVRDTRVLDAMRKVPRHEFVPPDQAPFAYDDRPLPIGEGQTISQPFIVGAMTEALELKPSDRVLEIGTGSGYQAAVLAEIVSEVYTMEIVEPLSLGAEKALARLGYRNVHVRAGDGFRGWPEHAPFDAIIVTCAPEKVPAPLVDQLKVGGRMVIPLGADVDGRPWAAQDLVIVRKTEKGVETSKSMDVRFVPMTGEAGGTQAK
ncbi:MAG: protein-L-isoaspartate(D-aspartate) O-methyltransferase [Elusimicrobiota bacterium]